MRHPYLRARTLLLVSLGVLLAAPAAAAGRVLRLVDEAGAPHAAASVSVVGRAGGARTDADGNFRLVPEPAPPFQLAVFDERGALLGLLPVEQFPEDGLLVLQPAPREQVTVLSGAAPSTSAPPAAAASVFSRTEREEAQPTQLVDALLEVPGAAQVGSGPAAVPSLRGLAQGRTLILLDDARVTAERRAGPSATYLNPFSFESVEIVRGMGSVAYGSDALGGVIHIRTPQPSTKGTAGRWELAHGRGNNRTSGAFELNLPAGAGALLFQAHARSIEDYDAPSGTIVNSGGRWRGAFARGVFPAGRVRLSFALQVDRAEDVGKPSTDDDRRIVFYPLEQSTRLTFSAEFPGLLTFNSLELDAYLGSYRLVTDRDTFATVSTNRTVERADVEANDASLRFVANRPFGPGALRVGLDVAGRFGLEARNTILELPAGAATPLVLSDEQAIESARRINFGVFVEVEHPIPRTALTLAGGVRGDQVRTRNSGGSSGDDSTSNGDASGYLALTLHPAKTWSAAFSYGRGFRDPRLSDRYFRGVTGRGRIEGNPELRPETSDQFDLAVHASKERFSLSAYAYHYEIDDLIERFRVSGNLFNFRNRGAAELRGVEFESDLRLPRGMSLRLTGNLAEGEIVDDGTPAADVPAESLGLGLRQRVEGKYWWRLHYTQHGRDDEPGDSEIDVPGYGLLDLSGGYTLAEQLELRLFLRNALDRAYPASPEDNAPLAPGVGFGISLAGTFP